MILGVSAILLIDYNVNLAARFIICAACIDMVDGIVARKFKVESSTGQVLDSIVDQVSFCLAPGLLLFFVLDYVWYVRVAIVYIILICGALRLARFGSGESKDTFDGLPTPAFAMTISAFVIAKVYQYTIGSIVIIITTIVFSFLMISSYQYLKVGRMNQKYQKSSANILVNVFASMMILTLLFELFAPYILGMVIPYLFLFFVLFYSIAGHFMYKLQGLAVSKIGKETK